MMRILVARRSVIEYYRLLIWLFNKEDDLCNSGHTYKIKTYSVVQKCLGLFFSKFCVFEIKYKIIIVMSTFYVLINSAIYKR